MAKKNVNNAVVLPRSVAKKATTKTISSKTAKNGVIPNDSSGYYNQSVQDIRNEPSQATALRKLCKKAGHVSSAVFSFVEIAKSGFTATAYVTGTNEHSQDGTNVAKSVMARLDTLYDYSKGYADVMSLDSLIETMLREANLTSFVGAELVLNEAFLPDRIVITPAESIKWASNGDGTKHPVQSGAFVGGDDIPLNIATYWTSTVHQDPTKVYASPMLEPAIETAVYYTEFVEDMRRSVRSTGHSRLIITLDSEKVAAAAPDDVKDDAKKLSAFMAAALDEVVTLVRGMEPEDALVTYDSIEADDLQAKDVKADYTQLLTAISGMLATSLKSHPSILGLRLEGSQSLSNTESMVFLKIAKSIQKPVEDVMSRALTLAVRLYGVDVYIKFRFNPINLRPEDELEAYKAMQQARILEQLSLGFLTDDQAAEKLGTGTRPAGAPTLSGTMFYKQSATDVKEVGAPRDAQAEAIDPGTPKKAGGSSQ